MEMNIAPPSPLTKSENMAHTWRIWKRDFLIYMKASKSLGKPNDVKAYMLRNCIGEFGQSVIEQISTKNSNHLYNMDLLIEMLDKHFPCNYEIQERHRFFTMQKCEKDSITNYIFTVQQMAETCNFGDMKDDLIINKILAEIKDKQLLQKLFETECLDLSKLTSIWMQNVKNIQKVTLNKDNSYVRFNQHNRYIDKTCRNMPQQRECCWRCGTRHPIKSCPAWGTKCFTCNTYNHYTSRCRQHPVHRQVPTAPPLLEFKHLYPNLNNADEKHTWSWMEQPQTQNEALQRKEVPNPAIQENKNKKKKEKNSCPVS
ncbi:hypothetical protein ANTQUA_LOCUS5430 [Anthophora quadrimaculata]